MPDKNTLQEVRSRLVVDNIEGIITREDDNGFVLDFSKPFEWLVLPPLFF